MKNCITEKLLLSILMILVVSGCNTKKVGKQDISISSSKESLLIAPQEIGDKRSTSPIPQINNYLSPPGFIRYGGADEITNTNISDIIAEHGSLGNESIRNLYKTSLSNSDRVFYLAITHDNRYKESFSGLNVFVFEIDDDTIVKKHDTFDNTLPYYEWYDGLRYKTRIPGDWVECGFVGDFNGDQKMEFIEFSALGLGFFMHIYEYEKTTDNFIKTFDEELNLGYKEMVQYGEAKGTKGFFLNNDILDPWHKKSFYGWDPDQRKYVFMASYLSGEEQK